MGTARRGPGASREVGRSRQSLAPWRHPSEWLGTPEGNGGCKSTPESHRASLSVLVQRPGLKHVDPCHFPSRHLAQITSLLVESCPSYFSTAETWLNFRNVETMVVTLCSLLSIWMASSPDSKARQGVQTPPGQKGHSSPRKPRLEAGAAHPLPAWAGLCQGGLQAQLPAGGQQEPEWL